jgi:ribosome-binding protein aMBF1 (putative translation factor)
VAAIVLRRSRAAVGLGQIELAESIGSHERTVRRREKGQVDLGILEEALRCPRFAAALGRELVAAAERMVAAPRVEEGELKEAA